MIGCHQCPSTTAPQIDEGKLAGAGKKEEIDPHNNNKHGGKGRNFMSAQPWAGAPRSISPS